MHAPDGDGATPLLQVINGSKVYGGLHAIQDVNFDLRAGEIHALLGENGAGKSTLCKAIAGAINLTSGEYLINGKRVEFNSPNEALKSGVAMVYQETSLVPSMTVARNLELGREKLVTIYSKINIAAQQSQQSLNFNVDPLALVETLGTAKRQMVEIVRAVRHHAKIFIFDEPTASSNTGGNPALFPSPVHPSRPRCWHHLYLSRSGRSAEDGELNNSSSRRQASTDLARCEHGSLSASAANDWARHFDDPLRITQTGRDGRWQTRRKGPVRRKRDDGKRREEHVVFGVRR